MRHRIAALALAVSCIVGSLAGLGAAAAAAPSPGGSVTVLLVGDVWPSLNPETNTVDALDNVINNAIFGGLFERTSSGIVPDLASGYTFSNGNKVLTIHLRRGVKFQDGTPFTAAAVAASIQASLLPANACICDSDFAPVKSVAASGAHDVVLGMSSPYPAIISAFIGEAPNWPVSPTALAKEGAQQFAQHPVGAGPFEVVSNVASAKLVLQKYPGYWQAGHPYLDGLTFESIGSDESAIEALQSNGAQVIEGIATASVLQHTISSKQFTVDRAPGVVTDWVQMNSTIAPFNQKKAREAVYYATDSAATLKAVNLGLGTVAQSPTGPAAQYHQAKVPGYRGNDLAKAKALVGQLGGLSFSLTVLASTSGNIQLAEALASQWSRAGITTKINQVTIGEYLQGQESHSYQAQITTAGGYNPSLGIDGLISRVAGKIGGEHDATINRLIAQTLQVANHQKLQTTYKKVYARISSQAYGPYLYSAPVFVVAAKSVDGLSPLASSTLPLLQWEDLSLTK